LDNEVIDIIDARL